MKHKEERGLTVTVCLPALDEAATIGPICASIRSSLLENGLVDRLLVVDSGSTDRTRELAEAAGASVIAADDILADRRFAATGKGGALWKGLAATTSDIVVWLDSDVRNFSPGSVTKLLGPLLMDRKIRLTKAFYDRPIQAPDGSLTDGGARVTELVVRPLAHLLFPELIGFLQPLSGECAGYRRDLAALPFFTDYGVEIGLMIDFVTRHGLDAVSQVDLGVRVHRNRDLPALGRMAFQVMQVMTRRAEDLGRIKLDAEWPAQMIQFTPATAQPHAHDLSVTELPPMKDVLAFG